MPNSLRPEVPVIGPGRRLTLKLKLQWRRLWRSVSIYSSDNSQPQKMENGAARNQAKMEKVAAQNRLIYGRLLLRLKYSGPWHKSVASQHNLAKDHGVHHGTISKLEKNLIYLDLQQKESAIQAATDFYLNHPVYREPFKGFITLKLF